jgi:hypothetical protein
MDMGLLLKLLALPVLGPIEGVVWVAKKVAEQTDKELFDADKVRGRLMELELLYDSGEINEAEYQVAEEVLLGRLRVIRERQAAERE